MAIKPPRKKSGPITRAFLKGLAIILPAIITIAIFAWVWDVLRIYVVELTIQAIDQVDVFAPRPMTTIELNYIDARFFDDPRQADPEFHLEGLLADPSFNYEEKKARAADPNNLEAIAAARALDATRNLDMARKKASEYRLQDHLKRTPTVGDLPNEYRGMTPPGHNRSVLQLILDTNATENGQNNLWKRDYDDSGRVIGYNWFDYLLAAVLGLTLVVLLGFAARNFFGRKFVNLLEWFVTRVPVVKSIYPHAKQLVEFFFTDNKPIEFNTVAMIEYPRLGIWSLAFVTGSGFKNVQDATGKRMVTVYVPSSPAPMTGYCMVMPADEVLQIDVSVEDAMKWVISGGVLSPMSQQVKPASGAQYALSHDISEQIRKRQTTILKKSEALKELEDRVTKSLDQPKPDDSETRETDKPK